MSTLARARTLPTPPALPAALPRGGVRAPLRATRRLAGPDLGNEPAIGQTAPTIGEGPRPTVSLRWLCASVLTGFAGFLLLGSAIYVSSQGDVTFAESPERAAPSPVRGESGSGPARKGDKLVRSEMVAAAKQTFRSPVTLRVLDREVIKVRTFTRISTGLSMTSGLYASDVPPFNPLRLFAEGSADRIAETAPPETSDAEVSVSKSDLSTLAVDPSVAVLRDDQVVAQIEEETRSRADGAKRAGPTPASVMLMRALAPSVPNGLAPLLPELSGSGLFRSIEVRVVPENVTSFDKVPSRASGSEERNVSIRHGDTVDALLRANGSSSDDARAASAILVGRDRTPASLEGMQLRLLVGPSLTGAPTRPVLRAFLLSERGVEAIAAMNDRGVFVSVTPPQIQATKPDSAQARSDDSDDDDDGSGPTLYNSLYETAAKQEIPRATVEDLVRIFAYDVDFQRRVSPGDSFDLFYASDEEGAPADRLEVLSAALTLGGEVHRVYRYQGDDSSIDFFDEAGRSLKKFLLRKPVVEARMSSPFGVRFHPILGYSKMHTGVDWAAPWGTPIFATGNGTVIKAEMSSGYGRRIELQHANGYVSTYNHMSAFARTVVPGAKIRQGQIVGYVGSIGLSTGPHVHYEVIVNGHFVDPMKIRVPRGRELDGRALADFSRQRDQIDQLIQKATSSNRLAQSDIR